MENIMIGFSNVFQLSNLFICIGGLMVGVLFGALPGFSATMAVAVFVPFTYVMEPGPALLLLSALYCGGVYGGSIPAVWLEYLELRHLHRQRWKVRQWCGEEKQDRR